MTKSFVIAAAAVILATLNVRAQTYYEYKFVFSGTAYQTNSQEVIVATHIADQTLLADRARQGNITNLNTISLVYHIGGGPPYVISNATGQTLTTVGCPAAGVRRFSAAPNPTRAAAKPFCRRAPES